MFRQLTAALLLALAAGWAGQAQEYVTDPKSPELQRLAKPLVVDESKYGCGPLFKPGKTYYVSLKGDDKGDGLSWKAAWRNLNFASLRLKPGDTLLIGEGEYEEGFMAFNVTGKRPWDKDTTKVLPQVGEPGRPIRIFAAPRQRVVILGSKKVGPLRRTPGRKRVYEAALKPPPNPYVWEARSAIMLQSAGSMDRVEETPGTYFIDVKQRKIHVRMANPGDHEGEFLYVRPAYHPGLRIHGSYMHFKGLTFKHCAIAIILRSNIDTVTKKHDPKCGVPRGGRHNTIEDCAFFGNWNCGIDLTLGAQWNLLKNNYGVRNEPRGTIMLQGDLTTDNLCVGNRGDPSAPTVRTRGGGFTYVINTYGGIKAARNHIINNVFDRARAFRWKPPNRQAVFQGNLALGSVYCTGTRSLGYTEADRMVLRSNVIFGPVSWFREGFGPGGPGADWAGKDKAFLNNFYADRDPKAVEAARFADPAWLDYRLQSDSPLKGKALGGGDRGAYRFPKTHVYYVSPEGDDKNPGTNARKPFRTVRHAESRLRPGDALYLMKGAYAEPLTIRVSGTTAKPIRVRAYRDQAFSLPGVEIRGAHVTAQGLRVLKGKGDGIRVSGAGCGLERCLVAHAKGAAVRATGAKGLTLKHCTLTGSRVGLVLENGSTEATVRDCLVADSRRAGLQRDASSRAGYRGYNNLWFGPGVDPKRVAEEPDSRVAEPRFADPAKGDYRPKPDSPARYLAEFARTAGAEPAVERKPVIADIEVTADHPRMAVIEWTTPEDDTNCAVRYRRKGAREWNTAKSGAQGTVHAVGLTYRFTPETTYEYQITAEGRRGGETVSPIGIFTTPAKARPAGTFHVAPSGKDKADGRTLKTAWRTLRKAGLAARPGDTILIAPGVYRNTLRPVASGEPKARITFRSMKRGAALIDGGGALLYLVFLDHKNYITIDGLAIDCGPTVSIGAPRLIQINSCRGIEILNCDLGRAGRMAMWAIGAGGCRDLRIEGNVVYGARYAAIMGNLRDTAIKNNTFLFFGVYGFSLGVKLNNVRIVNNIFAHPDAGRGVYLHFRRARYKDFQCDYNLFAPFKNPKCHMGRLEEYSYTTRTRKLLFPEANLKTWQAKTPYDHHSLYVDPEFVNPKKRDFRLKPGSPAIGAGLNGETIGALGVAR